MRASTRGNGNNPDFTNSYLVGFRVTEVPIPEPATMALLAVGGLAALRKKRK